MGMYGEAAIRASGYVVSGAMAPKEAWHSAIAELSKSLESQKKGCPKMAYLGLCDAGAVKGIPRGSYSAVPQSKNGEYAKRAHSLLHSQPKLARDKKKLWARSIAPDDKHENDQMDVVVTLWNRGLLH